MNEDHKLDPDELVLQHLARQGSDLSLAHAVRFYSYFDSREDAQEVAEQVRDKALEVELMPSANNDGTWLVRATFSVVPTLENLHALKAEVEQLTIEHRGEYDGWEAPITRRVQ